MLTSIRFAPPRTCSIATSTASPNLPSLMSRWNFFEPVTFVRSPIIWKLLSGRTASTSSPANCVCGDLNDGRPSAVGIFRAGAPATCSAIALM